MEVWECCSGLPTWVLARQLEVSHAVACLHPMYISHSKKNCFEDPWARLWWGSGLANYSLLSWSVRGPTHWQYYSDGQSLRTYFWEKLTTLRAYVLEHAKVTTVRTSQDITTYTNLQISIDIMVVVDHTLRTYLPKFPSSHLEPLV